MSKVRNFELERVFGEVDWLSQHQVDSVFLADANFGIFPRDQEIANQLCKSRIEKGYPKYVITNFAKSAAKRVKEIGLSFYRAGACPEGIVLSLQSFHEPALTAVRRKNLPLKDLEPLVAECFKENIPIGCEMIIGLPGETPASYRQGLYKLMGMGIHEGFYLYSAELLKNSPMANPEYIKKFEIESMPVRLYNRVGLFKKDEASDLVEIVVKTKDISKQEMLKLYHFSYLIQLLHCGGWTRFLSMYFDKEKILSYSQFYESFIQHFLDQPDSLIGSVFQDMEADLRELFSSTPEHPRHYVSWKTIQVEFKGEQHKLSDQSLYRSHWQLISRLDQVYAEVSEFLRTLVSVTPECEAVTHFQKDMMITPHYEKEKGKVRFYEFDLYHYFRNYDTETKLVYRPTEVWYRDSHLGAGGQSEIDCSTPQKYIATVCRGNKRMLPHLFTHQLRNATSRPLTKTEFDKKTEDHQNKNGMKSYFLKMANWLELPRWKSAGPISLKSTE